MANGKFSRRIAEIDAILDDVEAAKGQSATLAEEVAAKVDTATYTAGQAAQETEIGVLANAGAKNLFRCTYMPGDTMTVGGVTFTFNADGSITANGTKTNNDWLRLSVGNSLKAGTYELSSNVDGANGNKTVIVATGDSLSNAIMRTNTASGKTTVTLRQDYTDLRFALRIVSGQVCTNEVYKIMLRDTRVTDESFVPYAPTNRELYEMILALQS